MKLGTALSGTQGKMQRERTDQQATFPFLIAPRLVRMHRANLAADRPMAPSTVVQERSHLTSGARILLIYVLSSESHAAQRCSASSYEFDIWRQLEGRLLENAMVKACATTFYCRSFIGYSAA